MQEIKLINYCTRIPELYHSQAGEGRKWRQFRETQAFYPSSFVNFCNSVAGCGRLGGNCDHDSSQLGLRKGPKMQWGLLITPGCAQARYPLISSPSHWRWPDQQKKNYSIQSLALYRLQKTPSPVPGGQA